MKYNEISLTLLQGMCACVVCVVMRSSLSVCEVVSVSYVGVVVAVTDPCTVVCVACEYGERERE